MRGKEKQVKMTEAQFMSMIIPYICASELHNIAPTPAILQGQSIDGFYRECLQYAFEERLGYKPTRDTVTFALEEIKQYVTRYCRN